MKYYLLTVLSLSFFISGCQKKEVQKLTKEQVNHKVDSILSIRLPEIEQAAAIDLERRKKIEVKVKADSIVSARKFSKADTLKK